MAADSPGIIANSTAALPVNSASLQQVMEAVLIELKQLNFFVKQLPLYLNQGKNIIDEDADFNGNLTGLDILNNANLS